MSCRIWAIIAPMSSASQREQSVAAEATHQQAIKVMQAENAKALLAVIEGVRDNTTAVAMTQRLKTEPINSHAEIMANVKIPLARA